MSDPRETPFNGRVAHVSLKGKIAATRFAEGEWMQADVSHVPILRAPAGPRERELLSGQRFCVLEMPEDPLTGHAYGFAERDGYCGWVEAAFLHPAEDATHVVAVRETYRKETPDLKAFERTFPLFFGSRVRVTGRNGGWARIALPVGAGSGTGRRTIEHFVPAQHLRPVDQPWTDPVAVAELFLGTPYLWGGNSGRGIDCSGLVQAAMLACGVPCPGDSDQQRARLGEEIDGAAARRRGDLWFWEGHVGLLADPETLIHANAHHMAVACEPLEDAVRRIADREEKPVLCRRRVTPRRG